MLCYTCRPRQVRRFLEIHDYAYAYAKKGAITLAVHSERRGRIVTAPPLRRRYSDCAVTSPGGAFQTYTKECTLPIRIWPITDAVLSCSLADSDVVDQGAD